MGTACVDEFDIAPDSLTYSQDSRGISSVASSRTVSILPITAASPDHDLEPVIGCGVQATASVLTRPSKYIVLKEVYKKRDGSVRENWEEPFPICIYFASWARKQ